MRTKTVYLFVFVIFVGLVSISFADDTQFRLIVSRNDGIVGGRFHLDLETKVTNGTSPRTLNSFTADVDYASDLTAFSTDPDSSWFTPGTGYDRSASKLSGYYRVLVTGNGIGGANTGFDVTGSWQNLVTLRWTIGTVKGSYDVSLSSETDAAAYFDNYENSPDGDITEWASNLKPPATLKVATKIFLQGAYDTGTDEMRTALLDNTHMPTDSPYSWDIRTVASVPANSTDWVLLQLRSKSDGAIVCSKSVFIRKDGQIINDDGSSAEITAHSIEGEKKYFLVALHRNHVAIMSADTVAMNASSSTNYDFTTGTDKAWNGGIKQLETGIYGMYGGDCNKDGNITVADNNIIMNNRNDEGYEDGDVNLDGNVTIADNNICMNNRNIGTGVP